MDRFLIWSSVKEHAIYLWHSCFKNQILQRVKIRCVNSYEMEAWFDACRSLKGFTRVKMRCVYMGMMMRWISKENEAYFSRGILERAWSKVVRQWAAADFCFNNRVAWTNVLCVDGSKIFSSVLDYKLY